MKDKPTNLPASVLARLSNLARQRGEDSKRRCVRALRTPVLGAKLLQQSCPQ